MTANVDELLEADELSTKGMKAFWAGDLHTAESCLRNSLSIERRLGLSARMAADYGILAEIYLQMGALQQAEDALINSLKISDDPIFTARNYYRYAHLHIKRQDLTLAEAMAKQSYEASTNVDKRTNESAQELRNWILKRTQKKSATP